VVLEDVLDGLEDNRHGVLLGLCQEVVLDTREEVFSSEHFDLEVVPKGPPKVASIQIVLDLGQVRQEEGEGLFIQDCPAITSVVSIHKNSRGLSNQTGNCISCVLLR